MNPWVSDFQSSDSASCAGLSWGPALTAPQRKSSRGLTTAVRCSVVGLGMGWGGNIPPECLTAQHLGWNLCFPPLSSPPVAVKLTEDHRRARLSHGSFNPPQIRGSIKTQEEPERERDQGGMKTSEQSAPSPCWLQILLHWTEVITFIFIQSKVSTRYSKVHCVRSSAVRNDPSALG